MNEVKIVRAIELTKGLGGEVQRYHIDLLILLYMLFIYCFFTF
jgi:hypothetical protein